MLSDGARHDGGNYSWDDLAPWADRIAGWQAEGRQVWVYFNNDAGGFALNNARMLKGMLHGGPGELL